MATDMARVRLTAYVELGLKRRVKIEAVNRDTSISELVEEALRLELERETIDRSPPFSRASVPAFARDWNSDEDAVYDEFDS